VRLWLGLAAIILLGWMVVIPGRSARPRGLAVLGLTSVALAVVAFQSSCGGGSSGSPPPTAPSVSLTPTSLSFSTQTVGTTSSAQGVTLSNTGNAALSIISITASGDFSESNNCGTSVAAGANCVINVTFAPTQSGSRSGTLTISDNAGGNPQSVGLSGTAQERTPAGNYKIGVTGTSVTLVQSTTATLLVE
jgi:Abnormal spindle-like microcephaly-assoc'd, ASPM-SPD-2-Hydin